MSPAAHAVAARPAVAPVVPAALAAATRFTELGPFVLESGVVLPSLRLAWRSWGTLSARRDNVVLVEHALTGSADIDRWWPQLLGPGLAFDPERDFVVAVAALGSCSGSTGPLDPADDGAAWLGRFPAVTIRDQVAAEALLLASLGVSRVLHVAGGSMGGMRALEWVIAQPIPVAAASVVAAPAAHSSWAIGISAAQRAAITADPEWRFGRYLPGAGPHAGLAAARRQAMLSYRSWPSLQKRFGREPAAGAFAVEAWLDHHGRELVGRFDAASYVALTHVMDSHDVGRGRGGVSRALAAIRTPILVVGITSDALYPLEEVRGWAAGVGPAHFEVLESLHGHDAFLIDAEPLERMVWSFRRRVACLAA